MSEELKTAQDVVKEKLEKNPIEPKAKTDDQLLEEFKIDHKQLSEKILRTINDMTAISKDPERKDSFNINIAITIYEYIFVFYCYHYKNARGTKNK